MWKDFFYFSKAERKGIIVLTVLIIIVTAVGYYFSEKSTPTDPNDKESMAAYESFIASIHNRKKNREKYDRYYEHEQQITLAPFDPNTTDSVTFVRLGLRPYIARNILRYRAKGGKFRTPESFAKVYGITPGQFNSLLPFITIGEAFQKKNDTIRLFARRTAQDSLKYFKYPEGTIVNLNLADTTELKKIPGIGIGIAKRIIAYRSELGGFCQIEQLQEISHLSVELNKWFTVGRNETRRINLNKTSIERLNAHPYLNFYQAKVIVEYRNKKGALKSLNQLALYEEFTKKDFERIAPYICF